VDQVTGVAVLADHTQPVSAVAFSPDGRLLASASLDRTIGLWDTTLHTARPPLTSTSPINAVAFSPDGTALLSGGVDATVRRWDLASSTELSQWVGYGQPINALAFSPDGHTVVSSGSGPTAMLWSFQRAAFARSNKQMLGVAISPDARMVAAAGSDGVVRLFDVATRRLIRVLQGLDVLPAAEAGGFQPAG
jgi:WD40 repeat protein